MKFFKHIILFIIVISSYKISVSQNVMLNILTQKSGIIKKGGNIFLEASITNTNYKDFVGIYKLKVQISVPSNMVSIDTIGHVLPTGWKILSNTGSSITISNGMDMIAATDNRNLLISIKGNKTGGLSTITGQLSFSDGVSPGNGYGSLVNDLLGDNNSTTTCKVLN
jgi:hypothetical protein